MKRACLSILLVLAFSTICFAESSAPDTHPILSSDSTWAGSMLIIIAGLFLAAMVIGPIVRANMPDETPVMHAHDENVHEDDPHGGHGHGHGHGH